MVLVCGVLMLVTACQGKSRELNPVDRAAIFYESRPPFERPVARVGSISGVPNAQAQTCGQCHGEIFREWKESPHAKAWSNPRFQAELAKANEEGLGWQCVNCHTPAFEQMEQLVGALNLDEVTRPIYMDNPLFDKRMQGDGVGCATCHVSNGVVHGPWGDTRAPHAIGKSDKLLEDRACTQCHQNEHVLPGHRPDCLTDLAAVHSSMQLEEKTCQQCHMPEVERPLMDGLPARMTRRHWFDTTLFPAQD